MNKYRMWYLSWGKFAKKPAYNCYAESDGRHQVGQAQAPDHGGRGLGEEEQQLHPARRHRDFLLV